MNKYQRLIDNAEVGELRDRTTGGLLQCALYGDKRSKKAFVQLLPLFSNIQNEDRATQGAALADETGAQVLQVTHQGFKGSSLRWQHIWGAASGNFERQARGVESALRHESPIRVPLQDAVIVGESLGGAVASQLLRIGAAKQAVLIESCGMMKQSQFGLIDHLLMGERTQYGALRKKKVDAAVEGLTIPDSYTPTSGLSRRWSLNPIMIAFMFTPGFGRDMVYTTLDESLSRFEDVRVSGSSAENSLAFPNSVVALNYHHLQLKHGENRVFFRTVQGESHYTVTANPEFFAQIVQEQTAEMYSA